MKAKKFLLLAHFVVNYFFIVQAQSLKVEQIKDSTFLVAVNSPASKNKLLWNTAPDSWKNARPLALSSNNETVRAGLSPSYCKTRRD